MPSKPNYRHERTQKARTRELRRQEKQQRREEMSAKRKSGLTRDPRGKEDLADVSRSNEAQKSESC